LYDSNELGRNHPFPFFLPDQKAHYFKASFQIPSIEYNPEFSVEHSKISTDLKLKIKNEVSLRVVGLLSALENFISIGRTEQNIEYFITWNNILNWRQINTYIYISILWI
jgi:hypothetical protein